MNPILNYHPTSTHECACCGHEIEVNYETLTFINNKVRCAHCNALYQVDADAEFVGGVWYDKTKLFRV